MRAASFSSRFTGSFDDEGDDALGDLAVVHGVGDIVSRRRPGGADEQGHVDDELLTLATLLLEDAVVAERSNTRQGDLV